MRRYLIALAMLAGYGMAHASTAGVDDSAPGATWTFSIDALSWQGKASPLGIPFVTTGIVGAPETQVLIGPASARFGWRNGARVVLAHSLSASASLELLAFGLQNGSAGKQVASSGLADSTNLFVPYIDAQTGREAATELSYANVYRGSAQIHSSERLRGAEFNARWKMGIAEPLALEVLAGLAYLNLSEAFTLDTESPYLPAFGPDVWQTRDRFASHNRFVGIQTGIRAAASIKGFFGAAEFKVAAGQARQRVDVQGRLRTDDFTYFEGVEEFPGGYFALPSNIGSHHRDAFALLPQGRLDLGYRVGPHLTVRIGLSMLRLTNTLRPGPHIDRVIDTSQSTSYTEEPNVPGGLATHPGFAFHSSAYWVRGIHAGFDISF